MERGPKPKKNKREQKEFDLHKWIEKIDAHLERPEKYDELIDARVEELSENAEKGEIGYLTRRMHTGFIGPEMTIRRSLFVDPIHIDDSSVYKDLLEALAEYKETMKPDQFNVGRLIPFAIQAGLTKFFGNAVPTSNTESRNQKYLLDRSMVGKNNDPISISEYRGRRMGVCAEKSAVAQNMFQFFGIESTVLFGGVKTEEASDGHHLYQIVRHKGHPFLFDASNPRMDLDAEGHLLQYGPAMYRITDEQAQTLLNGGEITVEDGSTKLDENGEKTVLNEVRIYTGPEPRN